MSIVYIISAPSGSGKSTLVSELMRLVPNLKFSISYTTRPPRGSETSGREYFFVPVAEFEQMIRDDEFLEHAKYDGHYYGTARRFLREAGQEGKDLLLDIDVQGAAQIKKKLPDAVSIFIMPPDREKLERRLRSRGLNSEEDMCRRLGMARREIENYDKYDYILINDLLEQSTEDLKAVVLAERLGPSNKKMLTEAEKQLLGTAERFRLAEARARVQPIVASFLTPAQSGCSE